MSRPSVLQARTRRHRRVRAKVMGTAERPRLVVFRSNRGIEAQLVDDLNARTLAAASWLHLKGSSGSKADQATEVGKLLAEQGYVTGFTVEPARVGEVIRIELKYTDDRRPVISGLERVSRPGRRHYVDHSKVPRVQGGMGTAIVSTSSGVMTGHEAKAKGVGGEVVAYVW